MAQGTFHAPSFVNTISGSVQDTSSSFPQTQPKGAALYVILVFDEKKIKGRLVFDMHSGKLIGFTSLGDPDLDFLTFKFKDLEVATHALAFMVRGIQTTLKFMLAYFLTQEHSPPPPHTHTHTQRKFKLILILLSDVLL